MREWTWGFICSELNLESNDFRHRVANLLSEELELSLVERARGLYVGSREQVAEMLSAILY